MLKVVSMANEAHDLGGCEVSQSHEMGNGCHRSVRRGKVWTRELKCPVSHIDSTQQLRLLTKNPSYFAASRLLSTKDLLALTVLLKDAPIAEGSTDISHKQLEGSMASSIDSTTTTTTATTTATPASNCTLIHVVTVVEQC